MKELVHDTDRPGLKAALCSRCRVDPDTTRHERMPRIEPTLRKAAFVAPVESCIGPVFARPEIDQDFAVRRPSRAPRRQLLRESQFPGIR